MLSVQSKPLWVAVGLIFISGSAIATYLAWSARHQSARVAHAMTGGDPSRAPELVRRYGCGGCHTIPGIPGGDGQVGGSLAGIKHRVYIAGVAVNSPDNMVRWIVAPQSISPRSAMPATGISEGEARDIAAFLYAGR
jgi:cytochrome c